MIITLIAMDVTCLLDPAGNAYVKDLGWFSRFANFKDDIYIVMQGKHDKISNDYIPLKEHLNIKKIFALSKIDKKTVITSLIKQKKVLRNAIKNSDKVLIRYQGVFIHEACKIARYYSKPVLIELGGVQWDAFWNHGIVGKFIAPIEELWCRTDIKKSNYVHYVTKKYLQKRYPTKGESIGLSNVVLQDFDDKRLNEKINKIKNHSKKYVLGTAAAVNVKYKGQRYVIEALGKLKRCGLANFEYQIAGKGDSTYLRKIVKKNGVEDQVKFLGELSHEQVFLWLDNLDIYIQPSLQEGLPRAMIEAMSRGLPCIGAQTAGIPELINKKYIYKKENMKNGIVEKIRCLMDENEMIVEAIRNFKESKKFDNSIICSKRETFYSRFLTGKK